MNTTHYVFIGILTFLFVVIALLIPLCLIKYRSMRRTIRDLQGQSRLMNIPPPETPASMDSLMVTLEQDTPSDTPIQRQKSKSGSRSLWRPPQAGPRFTKADLSLMQLIKAGKEGVFYKAKMTRGTCKGHSMFTCKIAKDGVPPKRVETEVSIMRKLGHHKNMLQLLDWNTTEEPYVLILEYVSCGTLRSFLQMHRDRLRIDSELQSLFTMAAYHIALAMDHLRSKMVVHCDLALRNIMVNSFPREVKVAEFGLARDLTRMRSRRSTRKRRHAERVPLRWYPPEYFKNNYYSFKGDVWAFGIVLWEMQTFGTLPYPSLETSEEVIYHICAGYRNTEPENCRPEILQMMRDCWLDPYTMRPSFSDIVRILENILENDADYVDVDNQRSMALGPSSD
ncbi:fibroblast growth factor receptor homolog 1 [Megalops cyprinoides]|uniref:fibroblast growth factor receptor homolog 1 n=1 Tax=Megalops cyprinoides TaxID=118141 RepID=UPI00186492A3|nr:fibroblast growth factor receptor homolog 1 [Megalops cyprinoides]